MGVDPQNIIFGISSGGSNDLDSMLNIKNHHKIKDYEYSDRRDTIPRSDYNYSRSEI